MNNSAGANSRLATLLAPMAYSVDNWNGSLYVEGHIMRTEP